MPRAECWSSHTTRVYCASPTEWFTSKMDASSAKRATVRGSKKTKAIAQSMITPKSMTPSKSKSAALGAVALVFALAALAGRQRRRTSHIASVVTNSFFHSDRYDGHCRAVRIGLFGSRYSEISTVPMLLNRLGAMSFGTTWLSGGSGRLVSAQRTEKLTVQE